jgi:hypothetical protein
MRILLVPALTPLYLYVSTYRSMCALPNMAVFCSSLTSWFPGTLLTYFLNDFEMVPVAPIINGITFVFTFHMRCISIVRFLYFRIFSAYFLITFLSPEITSINIHIIIIIIIIIFCLCLLTPWCWVLLEKLTVPRLVKKYPEFYRTWKLITTFTRARQLSVPEPDSFPALIPHLEGPF